MATHTYSPVPCVGAKLVLDRTLSRLAGGETDTGKGLWRAPDFRPSEAPAAEPGAPGPVRRGSTAITPDEACPFDLEVPPPYAVDLRGLCESTGRPVPPEIQAKLGPNVAVLLCHRLTPFARAGEKPAAIWGLGYTARLGRVAATTIALVPDSHVAKLASLDAGVTVGLGAGGEVGFPKTAGMAGAAVEDLVPGWSLTEARLTVSADADFAFALSIELGLIEVQAGPVGAGGARWNLYRRGRRLAFTQAVAHTVTVPAGTKELRVKVETWVREANLIGGPATQWTFAPQSFKVPLA